MKVVYRPALLLIALSVVPALITLLVFFLMRLWAYQEYHDYTVSKAINRVLNDFIGMVEVSGALGLLLLVINYLSSFGIVVVLTVLGLHWFSKARMACFYIVSLSILIAMMFATPDQHRGLSRPTAIIESMVPERYLPQPRVDRWSQYWVRYPVYGLPVAIVVGGLIAMLPIFRPGKRYWLARGMCPSCQYDLQGEIDRGCPECGWNRHGPVAGRATQHDTTSEPSDAAP